MGSDRMLGLCSYGCFAAEGERTASAPEGAVVNQGRQCEKRSPTEIAVVLGIIEFFWRGECVFIRTRRTRSIWKAINHACLWWENLADGRAAPRLCAWHARPLGGKSCPTGGFGCFWLGGFWCSSGGGGSSESHVDGRELSAGRGNCLHLWTTSCSSGDGPLSIGRGACTSARAGPKEATNPSEGSSEFWPDGRRTELCAPKPRGRAVRIFCGASCFSGALLRSHSGIRQQVDSRGPTSFGRASGGCLRSLGSPTWAYEGPPVDLPIWDCMFAAACPRDFFKECSAGIAPATRGGKMRFTWHVGCEHVLRHDWHDVVQAQTPNTSNLLTKRTPNTSDPFTKRTPSLNTTAAFRNGFTPGLDVGIVAFLMTVYSFLWGLGFWVCSGILRFFRMLGLEKKGDFEE